MKKWLFIGAAFVIIGIALGSGEDTAANKKPLYSSSGGCKTTPSGEFKCDHSSSFGSVTSTSQMRCRTNPNGTYECKNEASAR